LGDGPIAGRLRSSIRALAEHRGAHKSICPSDAARAVGGEQWRDLMPDVYKIARRLAEAGTVEILQRGRVLDPAATWTGPVRIRIPPR
jgi:hypothetical protein